MKKKNTQPAVTYIRTATQDKAQANAQSRALRKFAAQNDYTIVKEYADIGCSGVTAKRPALQKLFDDGNGEDSRVVLTLDMARLARSHVLLKKILARLRKAKAMVIFTSNCNPNELRDFEDFQPRYFNC